MKSKFVKVTFVAAIVIVSGINVFNAQKSDVLSDIVLANVEALAGDEHSGKKCYSSGEYDIDEPEVLKCGIPCRYEPTDLPWFPSTSYCQ